MHLKLQKRTFKKSTLAIACTLPLLSALPFQVLSQESETEAVPENIIVTGTRVFDRSAADSPVPVDVIGAQEFRQNSSSDVQDLLRTAVPSFAVNAQPISDAATIVRPANLRGLSPDNVLVLVNGKRRHRGSVISFLGGGISDGAQGVDISAIPSLALKQVEVLKDGASSQYGSDAIAGVLNFILRDDAEGVDLQARYGSTYEGDGDNFIVAANIGLPLGDNGFVNLTGEFREADATIRSVVRDDVQFAIDNGYTPAADFSAINAFTDEVPQYWGQPDVEDDFKLFVNSEYEINEKATVYLFGNYGERTVTGGFFYRNVVGNESGGGQRGGVFAGPTVDPLTGLASDTGVNSVLVGDLDGLGVGGECIAGIPLGGSGGVIPDADLLAEVVADDNCFSFIETFPGGFTPRFGGTNEDQSITVGIRGDLDIGNGLYYDFSGQRGSNRTDFVIENTINASLGPLTPTSFEPGGQEQTETLFNLNFVYGVDIGFYSDLNIAFGAEYREEEFDLFAGDAASFELGPLASQGFASSSNGFGGFPEDTSASQDSTAFYIDLEAEVTEKLTVQTAIRTENFSEFGSTTDFKLAGLYHLNDSVRLRGAFSTGFHAPTAGQANITNVTTQNVNGVLIDQGTLPLSSVAGQLAADFVESAGNGRPDLGPEEAVNYSVGIGFDIAGSNWTIDAYQIELEDRVALGANVDFLDALNFAGGGADFESVSEALTILDANGTIDRADFLGLDDLSEFRFFSNSFDTTTRGIDVVGNLSFDLAGGESRLTVAANYNETEVDDVGVLNPIDDDRVAAIEDLLPNLRANISWSHTQGKFTTLLRANYFGGWDDTSNGVDNIDAEVLIDAQVAYQYNDNLKLIAGVDNLFDTFPEENPDAGALGQLYSQASPFGFNGGSWYLEVRYAY
ncbi:TonB-dependent receptor [Alteromonas sp. 5E99-2]|uniref:TonB-dependent receptor plug domain-containing protein n=1 Tax=Alteromonas sp. 5E99-2 TaxID=2817683 RepID=UPI001A992F98|nr:TonB-dependent receptor [Alteromonas sp. 5E99-2]MBO1254861.1 TonB-dependent receptor [Alteromonas sp. 5E99-2]